MKDEQYKRAMELRRKESDIARELKHWEKEITSPRKLGYLQGWNNNHAADLKSNISDELFDGFRLAAMNELKLMLKDIEEEFASL